MPPYQEPRLRRVKSKPVVNVSGSFGSRKSQEGTFKQQTKDGMIKVSGKWGRTKLDVDVGGTEGHSSRRHGQGATEKTRGVNLDLSLPFGDFDITGGASKTTGSGRYYAPGFEQKSKQKPVRQYRAGFGVPVGRGRLSAQYALSPRSTRRKRKQTLGIRFDLPTWAGKNAGGMVKKVRIF